MHVDQVGYYRVSSRILCALDVDKLQFSVFQHKFVTAKLSTISEKIATSYSKTLRDHNKKLGQNEFCTGSSKKGVEVCPILHANVQAVLGRGVAFLKPVLSQ